MFSWFVNKTQSKYVRRKMIEYDKKFQSINSQLKEIIEHEDVMRNEGTIPTMDLLKLFQKQMTCIIKTVHRLEDKYALPRDNYYASQIYFYQIFCITKPLFLFILVYSRVRNSSTGTFINF